MKPRATIVILISVAVGILLIAFLTTALVLRHSHVAAEPPWRFTPAHAFGKSAINWTTAYHWHSTALPDDAIRDRCTYRLTAIASKGGTVVATKTLNWNVAVDGDGHPVEFDITTGPVSAVSPYGLTSYINVDRPAQDIEFDLVDAEAPVDLIMVPREDGNSSASSFGMTRTCPAIRVWASNIILDQDPAFGGRIGKALPEIQDAQADLVTNAEAKPGMFPGGHQPVTWELKMEPTDPSLPIQHATIASGTKEGVIQRTAGK